MTYIIIAIVVLLVGAAAEIVAYMFTDKLLKKREDGLDRRKSDLDAMERSIITKETRKLVRICGESSCDMEEYEREKEHGFTYAELMNQKYYAAKYQVLDSIVDKIVVYEEETKDGRMIIRAELWVAEGGPDDGVS